MDIVSDPAILWNQMLLISNNILSELILAFEISDPLFVLKVILAETCSILHCQTWITGSPCLRVNGLSSACLFPNVQINAFSNLTCSHLCSAQISTYKGNSLSPEQAQKSLKLETALYEIEIYLLLTSTLCSLLSALLIKQNKSNSAYLVAFQIKQDSYSQVFFGLKLCFFQHISQDTVLNVFPSWSLSLK